MNVQMVLDVMRESFIRILLVAGPALVISMAIGLVISIFQATTQIQEPTLTFVPKLVAIFLTLILGGNFMINILLNFTKSIFKMIAGL
ncbi:flagellar biosynthesis protein FliQ [Enterococcus columbae]|uniref:Flagellar biosynthetic protein FliQ n=1 Tax=Enterococcus columbae DSM 7374 = ATCC 51263 TaxID=1121865 RepID=S1N4T2_9ENTE|nr:flagellar biosynthesis protein FliQ [Enterococcus columbae]EOT39997.1 flagellar biosynthetic protein FliQ [Enterococcus columbae DSM 7374 = ATCC 51263]EOW83982.1 flagellar biosynthetic protein FliQ [Enterococcus columbae DSM 7374 = ATCC 51263]OJG25799.1 flagellar biosynthetic protein FliQ [Enterococcus columbae DSM 7374 = ATCC 51263]